MPFGQALGHSSGDPIGFCYPYMWSSGALEVADDGKTVLFDTPTFEYAMNKFIQAWKMVMMRLVHHGMTVVIT